LQAYRTLIFFACAGFTEHKIDVLASRSHNGDLMKQAMAYTSDHELWQAVLQQIRQRPALAKIDLSVSADRGLVTLSGIVRDEKERLAIEAAAKEVWGVAAIVSDLRVRPATERPDAKIARDALSALKKQLVLPEHGIGILVRDGHVQIDGRVSSELQRTTVESLLKAIRGIKGVSNELRIESRTASGARNKRLQVSA
jgi:osmotically-inducible protein OsmY